MKYKHGTILWKMNEAIKWFRSIFLFGPKYVRPEDPTDIEYRKNVAKRVFETNTSQSKWEKVYRPPTPAPSMAQYIHIHSTSYSTQMGSQYNPYITPFSESPSVRIFMSPSPTLAISSSPSPTPSPSLSGRIIN